MKRDFEKYFPLPLSNGFSKFIAANGDTLDVNILADRHDEFMNYIVQCANLMPEAVRLLDEALRIIEKACIACANVDAYHCGLCKREETTREIKALLAKLEGGAEDERD